MRYVDDRGKVLEVQKMGENYVTVEVGKSGYRRQYSVPELAPVPVAELAQAALDDYAARHGFKSQYLLSIMNGVTQLRGEVTQKTLKMKLTNEERLNKAIVQNEKRLEQAKLEAELDTIKAEFKERQKQLDEEILRLTNPVLLGTEDRVVNGSWERNIDEGLMCFVSHDGEEPAILEVRPMTDEERQGDLFEGTDEDVKPLDAAVGEGYLEDAGSGHVGPEATK